MTINPLPFQEQLLEITSQMDMLLDLVNPDSELAEALESAKHQLEPFYGTTEWKEPVSFSSFLRGMKL
jgi:hypothetical protein